MKRVLGVRFDPRECADIEAEAKKIGMPLATYLRVVVAAGRRQVEILAAMEAMQRRQDELMRQVLMRLNTLILASNFEDEIKEEARQATARIFEKIDGME
mgnify:CR=1 FL=1